MKAAYFSNVGSGHLFSSLPMVEQLVKRGVEILYFSTEENREHIEAKGAKYCCADMRHFLHLQPWLWHDRHSTFPRRSC